MTAAVCSSQPSPVTSQQPPVVTASSRFRAVKLTNSSVYHYGVMAIFQMMGHPLAA